jgi:hypothetical protein
VRVDALKPPLSINSVGDGGAYSLPRTELTLTNLFLRIRNLDDLYIKVPSERGFEDYRRFVRRAEASAMDIRGLEDEERFERLESALDEFPGLKSTRDAGVEIAHYLAVHKFQYERLRRQTAVGIPEARFGVLRSTRLGFLHKFEPVLFQQRIRGTTLWSMYDFAALRVASKWRPVLPTVSAQLAGLLDSGLRDHVDWNIKNFVFEGTSQQLFYVDLKPSLFIAREGNEQNLRGIREYFII